MNSDDKKKVELLINKAIEEVAFFRLEGNKDPAKLLEISYYLSVAQNLLEHGTEEDKQMNDIQKQWDFEDNADQWFCDFFADPRLDKARKIIERNLVLKLEKGTYDPKTSAKLWLYWVEDGIKLWNGGGLKGFELRTRREIARKASEDFYRRYELGEIESTTEA